jgi:nucleoid-associated protein YgaU
MTSMTGIDWAARHQGPRLTGVAVASLPLVLALAVAACGTTDKASSEPLPPIRTTTSTSTIPVTTLPEGVRQFYTIKRGDTLASIAGATGVTVQSIIDLNKIDNPDAIQAGQTLEIPSGIVVIADLDALTPSTEG